MEGFSATMVQRFGNNFVEIVKNYIKENRKPATDSKKILKMKDKKQHSKEKKIYKELKKEILEKEDTEEQIKEKQTPESALKEIKIETLEMEDT